MSEGKKDSPHRKGSYGAPEQRDLLRGTEVPGSRKTSFQVSGPGFFDSPSQPNIQSEPVIPGKNKQPTIMRGVEYFRNREFPTDVWAPTGVAYYEKLDDIPTQSFRTRNEPIKIDSYEERSAVALRVCPPMGGESADASFKIVGERGLYVRVILEEKEETFGSVKVKKPIIKWMHFNEEDAKPKEIRFT